MIRAERKLLNIALEFGLTLDDVRQLAYHSYPELVAAYAVSSNLKIYQAMRQGHLWRVTSRGGATSTRVCANTAFEAYQQRTALFQGAGFGEFHYERLLDASAVLNAQEQDRSRAIKRGKR